MVNNNNNNTQTISNAPKHDKVITRVRINTMADDL